MPCNASSHIFFPFALEFFTELLTVDATRTLGSTVPKHTAAQDFLPLPSSALHLQKLVQSKKWDQEEQLCLLSFENQICQTLWSYTIRFHRMNTAVTKTGQKIAKINSVTKNI